MIAAPLAAVDLDRWLPCPAVRTSHRREATTDAARLWAAAASMRIGESGLLGRLIRWRVPGTSDVQTFREMFTTDPFLVLDEGEHHLLAGLCGTIWTRHPLLASLGAPADFCQWCEPGTVRVLFAQWSLDQRRGSALISEVRVAPVDDSARRRLRALWPLIARFEGLIGNEALQLAVGRAEGGLAGRVAANPG